MAMTLTGFIPSIYRALNQVSRELVGFIPSVYLNADASRVALNQTITYGNATRGTVTDVTSGDTCGPASATRTLTTGSMALTKSKKTTLTWTGENTAQAGSMYNDLIQQDIQQDLRDLVNLIEADVAATYVAASRAYGTAGTTPFATAGDFTDAAEVRRILADNGAPLSDCTLVLNTAAGAKIRGKQSQVYAQGGDSLLRQGVLLDIHGFAIRESAQVASHTAGTGAAYQTNGAVAAEDTTINADTGAGTIVAGDVVTLNGGADKYVVATDLAAGAFTIGAPGARVAVADNKAIALSSAYSANMAFNKYAIHLLTRLPPMPAGGDAADDVMVITDPVSGLSFEFALYRQNRQVSMTIAVSWGVKVVKPEWVALLLG